MLLEGKTIFLVEDDSVNLAIIRVLLKEHGANTPFDHWGDTTLSNMINLTSKPDIILLDIMLPGKVTGFDIFDLIKAEPKLANIPIVAVTASDPDTTMPKAKAKGFNGYISKPINRHKFPKLLHKVLNGEEVWEA